MEGESGEQEGGGELVRLTNSISVLRHEDELLVD